MTYYVLGLRQCMIETNHSGFTLVYKNTQTRDLRGIDEVTGTHVELSAQQVKGKFLSDVLALVDAEVDILHQGASGTDHIVPDTVAEDPRSATSQRIIDADDENEEMAEAPPPAAPVETIQDVRRNPARTRKPTRKIVEKL